MMSHRINLLADSVDAMRCHLRAHRLPVWKGLRTWAHEQRYWNGLQQQILIVVIDAVESEEKRKFQRESERFLSDTIYDFFRTGGDE